MKVRYLKLKNWFLLTLMGALGLSACKSSKDLPQSDDKTETSRPRKEIMLMYGTPTIDFSETKQIEAPDTASSSVLQPADTIPSEKPRNEMMAMYGVPTVDYRAKGRVLDSKGRPIKGAQVLLLNDNIDAAPDHLPSGEFWDQEVKRISDTTDAQGNFSVKTTDTPWQQPRILVRDIDGDANGSFENEEFPVDYSGVETSKGTAKGWRQGEKVKEDVVIKVKSKE